MTSKSSDKSCDFESQYLKDLETAFQAALKNKNISTALRAKELQAKLLERQSQAKKGNKISLSFLSESDIQSLIEEIESHKFSYTKEVKALQKAMKESLEALSS